MVTHPTIHSYPDLDVAISVKDGVLEHCSENNAKEGWYKYRYTSLLNTIGEWKGPSCLSIIHYMN